MTPSRFRVRLNDQPLWLDVEPGETFLQLLERHGYRMPRSCRNGVCEICEFELILGEIQQHYPKKHLHAYNNKKESDIVGLACTSVPLSDLWVNIKGLKRPGEQTVKRLNCDIAQVEKLNNDVYRVSLVLPATASQAVAFYAGQYLEIILPDGRQAAFSIGSAPEAGRNLELHIREVAGSDMSSAILHHLQTKKQVEIEIPKGECYLRADQLAENTPVILAAASTGFAQIKSIMEHLLASGKNNPIYLYWGARVAGDLYHLELPLEWAAQNPNVTYHPVVSEPGDQCGWTGRVDLLPNAIKQDFDSLEDVVVYTSGSPAMVYALLDALEEKGLKEEQMHSDVFAYAPRPKK